MSERRKVIYTLFLLIFVARGLLAQGTVLPGVKISAHKVSFISTGQDIQLFDSLDIARGQNENLGEFLSKNTSFSFRSYSPGGLITMSARGTGPEHSAIQWNGVPLNSPIFSFSELGLIPLGFFDKVEVLSGGNSGLAGNGALGGAINLSTSNSYYPHSEFFSNIEYGSFRQVSGNIGFGFHRDKVSIRILGFGKYGRFNFPFKNYFLSGEPVQRQENNEVRKAGGICNIGIKINDRNQLDIGIMGSASHRNLPGSMTSSFDSGIQTDSSLRVVSEWKHLLGRGRISVKTSYSQDYIRYQDSIRGLNNATRIHSSFSEVEWRPLLWESFFPIVGATYFTAGGFSDQYSENPSQNRASLYGGMKKVFKSGMESHLHLRVEIPQGYRPIIAPSIGIQGPIFNKKLNWRAAFSRNFNLPSLNMLYWSPGGNPDLRAEKSLSSELGLSKEINNQVLGKLSAGIGIFSHWTSNRIQWRPGPGGLWSPVNIQKVWGKGIEVNFSWEKKWEKCSLSFSNRYSFVSTTDLNQPNFGFPGTQLTYIPYHRNISILSMDCKGYYFSMNGEFTGKRFISADNQESLAPVFLLQLKGGKTLKYKSSTFYLGGKIENLTNRQYQWVSSYPQPGIAFYLQLKYSLTK